MDVKNSTKSGLLPHEVVIEFLLAFLVVFSPFYHGSVTALPIFLIETISVLILLIIILRMSLNGRISVISIPAVSITLFIFFIIFQLLPIDKTILALISKNTAMLYLEFMTNFSRPAPLSICPDLTIYHLLQFLSYIAIFMSALNYLDTEAKIRRLVLLIIGCGFIYSIYGIFNKNLSVPSSDFSTFLNRDHFAAYLEMIVFLCLGYSFLISRKTTRIIFIFIASIIVLVLFLTASRGGRVCFFISLFVFYYLIELKRPGKKAALAVTALVLFLVLFTIAIGLNQVMQRMETLLDPLKAYEGRFFMLVDSLKIVKDFPFFGTGFGTFIEIAQKYKTSPKQTTYGFSHSEPIQLLAEVGIVGTLAFLIFLTLFLKRVVSVWLGRRHPFSVYITAGCLAGIFSIILHSLFDFMFHIPANAVLFFIILALAYRAAYIKEPQQLLPIPKYEVPLPWPSRGVVIALIVLSFTFSEYMFFKRCRAELIFRDIKDEKIVATGAYAAYEYKKLLANIDRAISLNPINSRYANRKADILAGLTLRKDLQDKLRRIGPFNNIDDVLLTAERYYKKAIALNPVNADFHLKLGWLYSVIGDLNRMKTEFKKARLLDPKNIKLQRYIDEYINELQQ